MFLALTLAENAQHRQARRSFLTAFLKPAPAKKAAPEDCLDTVLFVILIVRFRLSTLGHRGKALGFQHIQQRPQGIQFSK